MTTSAPVRPSHNARPGKAEFRARIFAARAARPAADRARADAARNELIAEVASRHATIACYVSTGNEPDTHALLEMLLRKKRHVLIPWMGTGGPLQIGWGTFRGLDDLVPGPRGIPQPSQPLDDTAFDTASLVLCPALAATPSGLRLGTGGGWYDRALTRLAPRTKTACLVDDSEIFATIPTDPWDIRMDFVATQSRLRGQRNN